MAITFNHTAGVPVTQNVWEGKPQCAKHLRGRDMALGGYQRLWREQPLWVHPACVLVLALSPVAVAHFSGFLLHVDLHSHPLLPPPAVVSSSNVFLSSKSRLTSCSCSWTLTLGDVLQTSGSVSPLYLPMWQLCAQNEGILLTQLAGTYILFLQEGSCLSPQACGAVPLPYNTGLEVVLSWGDAGHVYANALDPYHPPGCHWALWDDSRLTGWNIWKWQTAPQLELPLTVDKVRSRFAHNLV